MAQLGRRLRDAPEDVLAGVLQTVCETLRLPRPPCWSTTWRWRYGRPGVASESILLEHEGQRVGALVVSPRTGEERLGLADRRVLEVLAAPVAVALHAVLLSQELQRSRERLVAAREEERRRLPDLHDGLGPTLTAVTLKADAARSTLATAPDRADRLLAELRGDAKDAIGDLRRIIYDLRPASLDELGLLGALGEQVDRFRRQELSVTLQAPPTLPALPAAVEVATYRIVTEALTNVARHAQGPPRQRDGVGWRRLLSRGPGRRDRQHRQRRRLAARSGTSVDGRARGRGRRHPPGRPHPNRGRVQASLPTKPA